MWMIIGFLDIVILTTTLRRPKLSDIEISRSTGSQFFLIRRRLHGALYNTAICFKATV